MDKLSKIDTPTVKMIRAIADGNNVDAYKMLEQVVKAKVARKIDKALNT